MDVHAPHSPIHGMKDFLLHLLTITIGLLIAVGIEGCVELRHEHNLVREARATLRAEIEHNSAEMEDHLKGLTEEKEAIRKNLETLKLIQEHPREAAAQKLSISADFANTFLRDTAWKTAQATGALSYMPYDEAQRYADVYEAQTEFLKAQDALIEDDAQFVGVMHRTDFGHGDITPEQAGLAAERFGIWQGHLVYLDLMGQLTALTDKAFLEGKEAPKHLGEHIDQH